MASPTSRTLELFRDAGYQIEVVESFNAYTKRKKDFFGFADMIAFGEREVIAVQATSGSNHANRVKKICANPFAYAWQKSGHLITVVSWQPMVVKKKDGKPAKNKVMKPRIDLIYCSQFTDETKKRGDVLCYGSSGAWERLCDKDPRDGGGVGIVTGKHNTSPRFLVSSEN